MGKWEEEERQEPGTIHVCYILQYMKREVAERDGRKKEKRREKREKRKEKREEEQEKANGPPVPAHVRSILYSTIESML